MINLSTDAVEPFWITSFKYQTLSFNFHCLTNRPPKWIKTSECWSCRYFNIETPYINLKLQNSEICKSFKEVRTNASNIVLLEISTKTKKFRCQLSNNEVEKSSNSEKNITEW